MMRVQLIYKGSNSFPNEDARTLINLASTRLGDVFRDTLSNTLLLLEFSSSEVFLGRETQQIRRGVDNPSIFTQQFCSLLNERYDVRSALNKLLNLDDCNLADYQMKIRRIFNSILPDQLIVREVEAQTAENVSPQQWQLGVIVPQSEIKQLKVGYHGVQHEAHNKSSSKPIIF
ncbi:hypothetical protein Ocin01_19082 [Orchesella cincta]|uniref:Uncharacterized protein n=1 Tax=Orchesella cincta TaxID=48709 RepID=A0A1D2M3Q4_ORCCI|nr:hypothetical protein Ocin01_19082 [Orchesella cincta]